MRIAAFYDIHGNLEALEAVLADAKAAGADTILVGGDVVPGPFPAECLEVLRRIDAPVHRVRGNGDHDALRVHRGETPTRVPPTVVDALRWTADRVGDALEALGDLPLTADFAGPAPGGVLFCHATPRDDFEIFTAATPEERLLSVFAEVPRGTVVCGHTHMQFDRRVGGTRVVNAGSVGMPFGDPGAYWALIDDGGVTLRRTDYDVSRAQERIDASGYPLPFSVRDPVPGEEMVERFEAAAIGAGR